MGQNTGRLADFRNDKKSTSLWMFLLLFFVILDSPPPPPTIASNKSNQKRARSWQDDAGVHGSRYPDVMMDALQVGPKKTGRVRSDFEERPSKRPAGAVLDGGKDVWGSCLKGLGVPYVLQNFCEVIFQSLLACC